MTRRPAGQGGDSPKRAVLTVRFGRLLQWMDDECNGNLAGVTGAVSARTLSRWRRDGPPTSLHKPLTELHKWARTSMPGYPPVWESGGLAAIQREAAQLHQREQNNADGEALMLKLSLDAAPVQDLGSAGVTVGNPVDVAEGDLEPPAPGATETQTSAAPDSFDEAVDDLAPPSPAATNSNEDGTRRRAKVMQVVLVGAVTLLILALIFVVLLQTVRPKAPTDTRVVNGFGAPVTLRTCPSRSCGGVQVPSNGRVAMLCWSDGETTTLNYRSNRWFQVQSMEEPTKGGWVHSSQVVGQSSVGKC